MGRDPEIDTLKDWFRRRFDPLTGRSRPFDRERFWSRTIPDLPDRRRAHPFGLRAVAAAAVTAVLLVGGGFLAAGLLQHGGFASSTVAGSALGKPPLHINARNPSSLAGLLPAGASRIELTERAGTAHRSVVITGAHDIAVLTAELGRAAALGPGVYHCPAATLPETDDTFRFVYPSGQLVTVNWLQAGCSWLTAASGPKSPAVTPGVAGRDTFLAPTGLRSDVNLAFQVQK